MTSFADFPVGLKGAAHRYATMPLTPPTKSANKNHIPSANKCCVSELNRGTKTPSAIALSGATTPYPPGTGNFHHEMELVVAIGGHAFRTSVDEAEKAVFGYACGLDMTRRDLQIAAREKQRSWDLGKDVEDSAVISEITPAAEFGAVGPQSISLSIGDERKQHAKLDDLIWSVAEIISHLSGYYHLRPGDLIYTGTPAGVGPVKAGDSITGEIDGLAPVILHIGEAE